MQALVLRFVLSGLVAVVLVSVITAQVSRNVAVDIAIAEALDRSIDGARRVAEPVLFDSVIDGDPAALARVDEAIRSEMSSTSLVSVNVWTGDGTIVYSTEPRLIGEQFDLHDDQVAIFRGSDPLAEVTDPAAPENRFEADEKLLEVYVLSSTQEGTPLLYEAYYRYSGVTTMGRQISRRFAPVALGAVLVVELVQIPLAIRLARRLRSGQLRHERLIGHAMAASDAERRRIADGLHVGALQELVGSSMSLAAASRTADGADPCLDAASAGVRESVKSLRSLLVDISPADVASGDLETAFAQLLERLDGHGVATDLVVVSDGTLLGPNTTSLLYRTAQELVRDVLGDGTASSVRFELRVQNGSVEFAAVDNRAVDDCVTESATVAPDDARAAGPTVATALSDLIHDAGGQLTTTRGVTFGRWTRVELPLLDGAGSWKWQR